MIHGGMYIKYISLVCVHDKMSDVHTHCNTIFVRNSKAWCNTTTVSFPKNNQETREDYKWGSKSSHNLKTLSLVSLTFPPFPT